MEESKKLSDKIKDRVRDLKGSVEHLNMQMHLGAKEAADEFENQKKNLGKWIDTAEEKLKGAKGLSEEQAMKAKASMEELRLQAALGKAESKDALEEQQKKISSGIGKLKHNLGEALDTTGNDLKDFSEAAGHKLDDFHTRFDLFKLQLHLGKEDAKKNWEEKKKELSTKLNDLKFKTAKVTEKASEESSDKWETFSDEMSEAWGHFRNAFKG